LHYYTFNIGDYRRDTGHLSLVEHGIYRQLIDTYYLNERPLDKDIAIVMRTHCIRSADEKRALHNVLRDFFEEKEDGWHHHGCKRVIDQYKTKSKKASESARTRWDKDANALPTHSKRNANGMLTNNHKPITNNQEKENIKEKVKAPEGVSDSVWKSFLEQRAKSRAVVTDTVLQAIARESKKAGWTLEQAMIEMVVRGWRGFKADWVAGKNVVETPVRWNSSVQGIMDKGQELGVVYRNGETIGQYEERIKDAMKGVAA
jgi:uncharacterized protein YdaU (DUF1376 family)